MDLLDRVSRKMYEAIDHGGLANNDVVACATDFAPSRVVLRFACSFGSLLRRKRQRADNDLPPHGGGCTNFTRPAGSAFPKKPTT